jgi:hypothetical protein
VVHTVCVKEVLILGVISHATKVEVLAQNFISSIKSIYKRVNFSLGGRETLGL